MGTLTFQFSTTHAWQSHVIRILTHSDFSHCDLVLPEGLLGASDSSGSPVVTGNPRGVAIRPFDYEQFKVRQRATVTTDKADAIITRARGELGKPFDDDALHAFLHPDHPRSWREGMAWFCAELHTWACEAEGFWPFELLVHPNRVAPADLLLLLNPYMDIDAWNKSRVEG